MYVESKLFDPIQLVQILYKISQNTVNIYVFHVQMLFTINGCMHYQRTRGVCPLYTAVFNAINMCSSFYRFTDPRIFLITTERLSLSLYYRVDHSMFFLQLEHQPGLILLDFPWLVLQPLFMFSNLYLYRFTNTFIKY